MLTLEVTYDFDFLTLGINSREPAYRVCWLLNKTLGLNLKRDDENHLVFDNMNENHHIIYSFFNEDDLVSYSLIRNKSENNLAEDTSVLSLFEKKTTSGLLIPELAKMDYFLKITDLADDLDILEKTRKISYFNAVFDLDVNKLKSKENLIFE